MMTPFEALDSSHISLVFLDIDGTLVGHSGHPDPCLWPALDAMKAAGIRPLVCTGRPYGGVAAQIAHRLDPNGPHIFHGGALVRADDEIFHAHAIPTEQVLDMISFARANHLTLELYSADTIFVDAPTSLSTRHAELLEMTSEAAELTQIATSHQIIKTQWILTDEDRDLVLTRPHPGCHLARATSDVMPGVTFVTVTAQGVDKGSAARSAAAIAGVDMKHTAGVGDSSGDIPLFDVVDLPLLMSNADPSLHHLYTLLPGIDEHGVRDLALKLIAERA